MYTHAYIYINACIYRYVAYACMHIYTCCGEYLILCFACGLKAVCLCLDFVYAHVRMSPYSYIHKLKNLFHICFGECCRNIVSKCVCFVSTYVHTYMYAGIYTYIANIHKLYTHIDMYVTTCALGLAIHTCTSCIHKYVHIAIQR